MTRRTNTDDPRNKSNSPSVATLAQVSDVVTRPPSIFLMNVRRTVNRVGYGWRKQRRVDTESVLQLLYAAGLFLQLGRGLPVTDLTIKLAGGCANVHKC